MAKGKYATWLEPENLLRLEAWARDGLTLEQIAHNIGCSASTLHEWINRFPEISEALKRGADVADIEVENALHRRAVGYSYDEIISEPFIDPNTGKEVLKISKVVRRHVIPDTTAQIYWLKNRRPSKWRDKPVDETGKQPSEIMQSLVALLQFRGGQKP